MRSLIDALADVLVQHRLLHVILIEHIVQAQHWLSLLLALYLSLGPARFTPGPKSLDHLGDRLAMRYSRHPGWDGGNSIGTGSIKHHTPRVEK